LKIQVPENLYGLAAARSGVGLTKMADINEHKQGAAGGVGGTLD
jgi:hypothetical protein